MVYLGRLVSEVTTLPYKGHRGLTVFLFGWREIVEPTEKPRVEV